jgi:hypothetical protein
MSERSANRGGVPPLPEGLGIPETRGIPWIPRRRKLPPLDLPPGLAISETGHRNGMPIPSRRERLRAAVLTLLRRR